MDKDEQINMIKTQKENLVKYWQRRNTIMLKERNIVNLEPPEEKQGQSNWTTNEPKVFFDTSRSLLSINEPRFRIPAIMTDDPEQQGKMDKAERLCIGIYRALNDRQVETGGVNWLWDLAYYILLGYYSVFSIVQKDQEGQIQFIADIFDPLTIYPQWDTDGMVRCVRNYTVDTVTAQAMASSLQEQGLEMDDFKEPTSSDGQIEITNYWLRSFIRRKAVVQNAIMIGGQLVKPLTIQKKLRRIPIHVGSIGSPERSTGDWMAHKGESIIAVNKLNYEYLNDMLRLMAQILAENAYPNRLWNLIDPHGHPESPKGFGTDIKLKINEKLQLIQGSTTPQETDVLMQYFLRQSAKGSVPDTVYGNVPVELSGFAISQLMAAVKYKLGMYLNALQKVTSRVMTDFLYQYKVGGFGKVSLMAENPQDLKRGMAYLEDFTTEDVPKHIYVDVAIPISSQFDKTQAYMNAVQVTQAGLMSKETAWEEMLDIQDREQEKQRIRDDQVSADPFIINMEVTERMWARVEYYEAKGDTIRAEALKRYIMLKEMELGIRQGVPEKVGVSPSLMPPEARPTPSPTPDQRNAMIGKPPPKPNRPVHEGRKGVLVNPQGQPLM